MSKIFGSNKLKIVAVTSLAIFSLFAACTATLAWFTGLRASNNGQGDIPIVNPKYVDSVIVRPFKEGYREVDGILTFDTKVEASELGHYSILEGNSETVIEVKLTPLGASLETLSLSATTLTEHYLAETDPDGELYSLLAETGNPLSSVLDFTVFTEDDWKSFDVAIYNYFTIDKNELSSRAKTFVTDEDTLNSTITISNSFTAKNNHFFILLSYNEFRINEIYAANLGNPVCSGDVDYVQYSPDFSFLVSEGQ